jgi:hypothetical protein
MLTLSLTLLLLVLTGLLLRAVWRQDTRRARVLAAISAVIMALIVARRFL